MSNEKIRYTDAKNARKSMLGKKSMRLRLLHDDEEMYGSLILIRIKCEKGINDTPYSFLEVVF